MPLQDFERNAKKWFVEYCNTLDELFTKLMREHKATHLANDLYEWSLQTNAGLLRLTCYGDWIATRFENPGEARKFFDCNPHSGKWNHHTSWGSSIKRNAVRPDVFLAQFIHQLRKVLS